MKFITTFLLLLTASTSFALPKALIEKVIGIPSVQTAQVQGLIGASIYCYNHHLSCSFVLTDTGGSAIQVLSVGNISLQTLHKSRSISYTAASLHIQTQSLAQTIKTHPIAKELNTIYANGVPISFFPGGFFSPSQAYGYGIGITIQTPKDTKSDVKSLDAMDTIFNRIFKTVIKTKKPIYNLKTLSHIPKGLLKQRNFEFFIAAIKLTHYCESINFTCSTATANLYGTRTSLVSSIKILPIYTEMSTQHAILSGMTGANPSIAFENFPYQPGEPIFQNNMLIGGVGISFMRMSTEPAPWKNYYKMFGRKYIQIYHELHQKFSTQ